MSGTWIFLGLVFLAAFMLAQGTFVPTFGENARMRKRLLARLADVANSSEQGQAASLLREKYLNNLSPFERWLEGVPGYASLVRLIEQCGETTPAYQVVILSLLLAALGGVGAWVLTRRWDMTGPFAVACLALPWLRLARKRAARVAKFDEQLPEALDLIKRALQAGHPFSQCLKLVADDMDDPIGHEFGLVFSEVSYGSDVRRALHGLLERMPSVSVMALVTAVLVQKETGGNLAETMERITTVIRGRFKLHRRVRTLSAEGRLSAWILAFVPLVLFAAMWVIAPNYLPVLTKDPRGQRLLVAAVVLACIGLLWIRKIIRIRV
jgi:tight adherence protein B